MRRLVATVGLLGLAVVSTSCSEISTLEISNPCPVPVRMITWDSSSPVVDIDASSRIEIDEPSYDGLFAASSTGLIDLPAPREVDEYGSELRLDLPETLCSAIEPQAPDVIVVGYLYEADRANPLQVSLYSNDPTHLTDAAAIAAQFDPVTSETSRGDDFVAITFYPSPDAPTSADADDSVDVDLSDGVDKALAIAGPDTFVLDCMRRRCLALDIVADGALSRPLVVKADTPKSDYLVEFIVGALTLWAMFAVVALIVGLRARSSQRRRRLLRQPPPPPAAVG